MKNDDPTDTNFPGLPQVLGLDDQSLVHLGSISNNLHELRDRTQRETERWLLAARAHVEQFPLTGGTVRALLERVQQGGALCCSDGLAFLRRYCDVLWALVINDWAYETLSCNPRMVANPLVRQLYADKLDNLLTEGPGDAWLCVAAEFWDAVSQRPRCGAEIPSLDPGVSYRCALPRGHAGAHKPHAPAPVREHLYPNPNPNKE